MPTIAPHVRSAAARTAAARTDDRDPGKRAPQDRVLPGTRCLLVAFTLLTALATHQLLVQGRHTATSWAWTISSAPTAAFLGAAYAAGCLLSLLALRQRDWSRIRIAVATVSIFTALTLVATLVHLHKLHLTAPDPLPRTAAWFWLVVYLAVPVACAAVLLRQGPPPPADRPARRPLPGWLTALLTGHGLVLAAAGAVLFAGGFTVHHGTAPLTAFWAWPLGPLGAQIIGAWLLAFAAATALVLRDGDLTRLRVPATAYTAFGVFELAVLATSRAQLDSGPSLWISAAVVASIAAAGGYGSWRAATEEVDSRAAQVKVIGIDPRTPELERGTEAVRRPEGGAMRPGTRLVVGEHAPSHRRTDGDDAAEDELARSGAPAWVP
jgi:hypothetical protein